ncbi:MAG: BatD family protein [Myxococcota bacterium]
MARTIRSRRGDRFSRARGLAGLLGRVGLLGLLLFAQAASAQEARVQVARGPYYLGQPFALQVAVTDFEEEPAPTIEAPEVDGGRLRYAGVSPSTSTSISIVNGRMTRKREVKFVYQYELTPLRRGVIQIPEFEVEQGPVKRATRGIQIEVAAVPRNEGIGIKLELPEGPIFVGQKVPIAIEFQLDVDTRRDLINYSINVPLFNLPNLRFLDSTPPGADTNLEIETEAGTMRLSAISTEKRVGGREVFVVRAERTMIALSGDSVAAEGASVFVEQGTRFRRDLFNQRQATASQKFMAKDPDVEIEVAEVPRQGRPPSFAGAIGEGFTLDVVADRSVVQIGEPIQLTFNLRGNGDLSSARLPPLDAEGLFDPNRFRLPEEPPAGIVTDGQKSFEVTLRVLDASVREIPELAYSWFDADSRRFETTLSRPIALSVGAAEIIGADAVTRRAGEDERAGDPSAGGASAGGSGAAGSEGAGGAEKQSSLVQSGANLAVERDIRVLTTSNASSGEAAAKVLVPALYAFGVACLLFAFWERRRQSADPAVAARKQAFGTARKAIRSAGQLSATEGAGAMGRALRELVAAFPGEDGPAVDALLQECDALRFAPEGTGEAKLPRALVERAEALIAERELAGGAMQDATTGEGTPR